MSDPRISDGSKSEKVTKRLNLRKETLRELTPKDLKAVVGGDGTGNGKELDIPGGG